MGLDSWPCHCKRCFHRKWPCEPKAGSCAHSRHPASGNSLIGNLAYVCRVVGTSHLHGLMQLKLVSLSLGQLMLVLRCDLVECSGKQSHLGEMLASPDLAAVAAGCEWFAAG